MIGIKKKNKEMKEIVEKREISNGEKRFQREQQELEDISNAVPQAKLIRDKNKENIMDFKIEFTPDENSYWYTGKYEFIFHVPDDYPYSSPKVHCSTKIYHPNIDYDGNVCLNILKEDWKPTLTVSNWIAGVNTMFYEPNPEDPLNPEVAKILRENESQFKENVKKTLKGGRVFGQDFPYFK